MTGPVAAIIPAAGLGTRLASPGETGAPKAVRQLAGQSLLLRAASTLSPCVDLLVVAAHHEHVDVVRRELADLPTRVDVVPGGASRQESVAGALELVPAAFELVLVHDAARPLAPRAVVLRVLDALGAGAIAVVPAVALVDTLRATSDDGTTRPLDRTGVRAVQTPQGFRRAELVQAHATGVGRDATDDASLVEALGYPVRLVDGDPLAFKITRPLDLLLAESVLADLAATAPSSGRPIDHT